MNKLNGMIGLSVKAGKTGFGSEQSVSFVRNGKAKLVIVACDASDRTKKLMTDKCKSYNIQIVEYGTQDELARITGKRRVSVLSVCDRGFADAMLKIYGGGCIG